MSYQHTTEGMVSMMRLLGLEPSRGLKFIASHDHPAFYSGGNYHSLDMFLNSWLEAEVWIGLGMTGIEMELLYLTHYPWGESSDVVFQIYEIDELMELLS